MSLGHHNCSWTEQWQCEIFLGLMLLSFLAPPLSSTSVSFSSYSICPDPRSRSLMDEEKCQVETNCRRAADFETTIAATALQSIRSAPLAIVDQYRARLVQTKHCLRHSPSSFHYSSFARSVNPMSNTAILRWPNVVPSMSTAADFVDQRNLI